MVPFLVVHVVDAYRSAPRSFVFIFSSELEEHGG